MNDKRKSVEELCTKSQVMVLIGLTQDYANYSKIKEYIDITDFTCPEYQQAYNVIRNIYDNCGYKTIDEFAFDTYSTEKSLSNDVINTLKTLLWGVNRNKCKDFEGAFNTFRKTSGVLRIQKLVDSHGGFENMIFGIYDKCNSSDDIRHELDTMTRQSFRNYKTSARMVDMGSGMLDYVKNRMFEKGDSIELQSFPLLQSYSKGIHVGMTGVMGYSGTGKTSATIPMFSMSILESLDDEGNASKLLSIHNEQDEDEIRQLYLVSYISMIAIRKNKAPKNKNLHRDNFNYQNKSNITDIDMSQLEKYAVEFEERYAGRLKFIFVPRFNENDLEAMILDHERLGYKNVLLDTFKTEDSNTGWEGMENMAKRMDGISKDLKIKIIYTAQLASHMIWRRYLDQSCIGKAKGLKDTATSLYLFRPLTNEEKKTIKCSYWKQDKETKKMVWTDGIELDPTKEYYAYFNDKQRKGKCGNVIILQYDMGYLFFREIGVTNGIVDDRNSR